MSDAISSYELVLHLPCDDIGRIGEFRATFPALDVGTYHYEIRDPKGVVLSQGEHVVTANPEPQVWTQETFDLAVGTLADIAFSEDLTLETIRAKSARVHAVLRGARETNA